LEHGEAWLIRRDPDCAHNFIKSYQLMLDFYGFQLEDLRTGRIGFSPRYKERLAHLNSSFHNNLRITRMITCLGHFGFTRYKKPFVNALGQAIKMGYLPSCKRSYKDFWLPMLDYNTAAYNNKTQELAIEREPSVFFYEPTSVDQDLIIRRKCKNPTSTILRFRGWDEDDDDDDDNDSSDDSTKAHAEDNDDDDDDEDDDEDEDEDEDEDDKEEPETKKEKTAVEELSNDNDEAMKDEEEKKEDKEEEAEKKDEDDAVKDSEDKPEKKDDEEKKDDDGAMEDKQN